MMQIKNTFKIMQLHLQQDYKSRKAIFLRILLYYFIIYIFSLVFKSTTSDIRSVIYICTTQILVSSFVSTSFEIYAQTQSDSFSLNHLVPSHYLFQKIIYSFSTFLVRFFPLVLASILFFYFKNFSLNLHYTKFICVSLMSAVIYAQMANLVGLLSYFLKDPKVLFYLNMTTSFSLGGLIIPVQMYTPILKTLAHLTPYPYLISYPSQILTSSETLINEVIFMQFFWLGIISILTLLIYKKIKIKLFTA